MAFLRLLRPVIHSSRAVVCKNQMSRGGLGDHASLGGHAGRDGASRGREAVHLERDDREHLGVCW